MTKHARLVGKIQEKCLSKQSMVESVSLAFDEATIVCHREQSLTCLQTLRDDRDFAFDQLIDICAVDYLLYGIDDWETGSATDQGFSRGVERQPRKSSGENGESAGDAAANPALKSRFAVVYHLLSTKHNHRVRVKVFLEENQLMIPSVQTIWQAANWFEREAYDLYGILFENHPDLRRILTDYGFIGYPFRKDFPVSGHVEMRYDASLQKVIYEPVDIEPRVLVPKVIRNDSRYLGDERDEA